MKNDKYEFLYNYARASFEDELLRFKNIEEKASRYISLMSMLILGYSILLRFSSSIFFPPSGFLAYVSFVTIILTYISLISSWSFLFRALKFIDMPRMPLNKEFIEKFKKKDLPTNHYTLSVTCSNALTLARKSNTEKSKLLIKANKDIVISLWLLSTSLILITLTSYVKQGA